MLPNKTIKKLKKVYGVLCKSGCLPYKVPKTDYADTILQNVQPTDFKFVQVKVTFFVLFFHSSFLALRLSQVYHFQKNQKFFLKFFHFAWLLATWLSGWLYATLFLNRFEVLTYCNGLFQFYGSFFSMPGARISAKCRRKAQRKPCLTDLLVIAFLIGATVNILMTVHIFLRHKQSLQFVYSVLPTCWVDKYPVFIILFCAIYEAALPCICWVLMLFFVTIHLVHLLDTREYLILLKRNTRQGILKLGDLCCYYRSIQILHNHYNFFIAKFMPLELMVLISLSLAGNIGTIRIVHSEGHVSITETTILPLVSVLTLAFQMIFYQRAGELHHLSSYFIKSSKKGLFPDKSAKLYLRSFPPLCVKVGTLLDIKKFTVVKFVGGIVVGTSRLSILFFR